MTDISKQKFLISSGGGTTTEDTTFTVACCAFELYVIPWRLFSLSHLFNTTSEQHKTYPKLERRSLLVLSTLMKESYNKNAD